MAIRIAVMNFSDLKAPSSTTIAWCWVLALAVAIFNFALQGRLGMDMADEGFFYYGVLRVRAGDIPIADFQAYEPYRYYWTAAWTWLTGDSLYAVRAATAVFGGLGLAAGLFAVARIIKTPWQLALIGLAISWCNYYWYRQFDTAVSLIAIWVAVRVAEHATTRGAFTAGALVGLIAGFGHNHGFYCAVVVLVVVIVMTWRVPRRDQLNILISYFIGIAVGYLPIVAHFLFVPHYFSTLWGSVVNELRTGSTNLALPVPWPWLVPVQFLEWPDAVYLLGIGVLFVAVPLTYGLAIVLLFLHFNRNDPVYRLLLASVTVGILYLQHAFSRADDVHLLEGIPAFIPTIVALLALAERGAAWPWPRAILLAGILPPFLLVNSLHLPRIIFLRSPPGAYALIDANGSTLAVPKPVANAIAALRKIKVSLLKPEQAMLVAPHWPMAYALLRQRSPIWEIYFLLPRSEAFQRHEISELERQHLMFAIYADISLDGRSDRRLSLEQPLLYRYLSDNYAPIDGPELPEPYRLYRRTTPFPPSQAELLLSPVRPRPRVCKDRSGDITILRMGKSTHRIVG